MDADQLASLKQAAEQPFPFVTRTGVVVEHLEPGCVRLRMPLGPNRNHVGTMYAGALFTLAELPGGCLWLTSFDTARVYPVVKDLQIRFRRPAATDIRVEARLSAEQIRHISHETEARGKCDFTLECELKDEGGEVVALSRNFYQLRRIGH